ncbi:MAG TPA: oligopeptide transporter, OPT family [Pyrinomonadaceae bacterium]|nr:oligopeptide transporter, OPT family [Pyrinomonadaceae bacterium]
MKNPFLENFRPYIPASVTNLRELTVFPLIVGTLLGILFGASSLYLVLKTGLTVSASIPVAVIAITLFRLLSKAGFRDATILESNIMQTTGSAGESIAFGVGVTMPAILILGFDLDIWHVTLVAVLGGLLGILMMIPLRRALIRDQHGILKYPEGTACAQVLIAGASKESREAAHDAGGDVSSDEEVLHRGKIIAAGFGLGFLYKSVMDVFSTWNPEPGKDLPDNVLKGGSIHLENNPALLGVGYIIGPYIASIMVGGGILSYLVLIPLIKYFGDALANPLAPATGRTIAEMSPGQIRGEYILYIGAGAVTAAGIISLARSLPTIWSGLKSGLADLRGASGDVNGTERTDQDISMKWVIIGLIVLLAAIMLAPSLGLFIFDDPVVSFLGALLIIILGFLFVTVSSRLTGEVGSSSNPISGMTVATLLFTCLVFLALGWTAADPYFVTALSIGGIVCIAASNGGTTSQDLKTGFWVGGTPRRQQIAILVGALASALVLGPLLLYLNTGGTYYQKVDLKDFPAGTAVTEAKLFREGGHPKTEVVHTGEYASDTTQYHVWQNTDPKSGPIGKYLVNTQGQPVYLVDPAINGVITEDSNGNKLTRYDAPKATLMSYIIKGVLGQDLPWGLVLIGAMIAIMLEIVGVPSLAFAVGLYLPLATSAPIFVGGIVRKIVDVYLKRKLASKNLTEDEIVAETDKSHGVLLASGYIAGAAIAGILIAIFAVVPWLKAIQDDSARWAAAANPFFGGDTGWWLGAVPFLILAVLLYFVGREKLMKGGGDLE